MVHHQRMILPRFKQAKCAGCQVLSSRHAGPVALAILETTGPLDGVRSNFTSAKDRRPHKTALVAIGLVNSSRRVDSMQVAGLRSVTA